MKDIVEILRYAPEGTVLYSPLCGKVELVKVTPNIDDKFGKIDGSIRIRTIKDPHPSEHTFDRYGRYMLSDNAVSEECMLFPQILHRTWDNWQDILIPKAVGYVVKDTDAGECYFVPKVKRIVNVKGAEVKFPDRFGSLCYASPEDTIAFITALNCNHIKWCKETGEMVADVKGYVEEAERKACAVECLSQHRYSRGDKVICMAKGNNKWLDTIQEVDTASRVYKLEGGFVVSFDTLDDEDGNFRPAELDSRKPFTEDDLHPFDEVLVRRDWCSRWVARHYSHFGCTEYVCTDGEQYEQCVPYNEETKCLLGTSDEYTGKYKTWYDDVEY